MNTKLLTSLIIFLVSVSNISAQEQNNTGSEKFGNTLNAGVGIGYYGYVGRSIPVLHANFEFDVAKNFTLAPFITVFSYESNYYWGNPRYPYRNYRYRQTAIPIGVKGAYYFDGLLNAGSKWDFYLAGSLGFVIRTTNWENDYYGDNKIENGPRNLYLDVHVGTEYHLNNKIGLFLDLSSGVSTFGLAAHF